MEILLLLVAVLFAINIGASGTAAAMGEAYGTGVLGKRVALVLVALFVVAGAALAGGEVVETIGKGIIPQNSITLEAALVALLCAIIPLFLANILGIPLSTSEVTVGALIGVGLAIGGLQTSTIGLIILSWTLLPILAFILAAALQRLFGLPLERMLNRRRWPGLHRAMALFLIAGGSYTAFAAGANNAANAVGPLVGVGILSDTAGLAVGGLFLGIGAIALGGRVLETNARKITRLSMPAGIAVNLTAASLVLGMSLLGMPVPLTQATTGAITGVGFARSGRRGIYLGVIKRVVSMWVFSPAVSLMLSFFLMNFLQGLQGDFSTMMVVVLVSGALTLFAILLRGRHALFRVLEIPKSVSSTMGVNGIRRAAKEPASPGNGLYSTNGMVSRPSHTHSYTDGGA